FFVLLRSSSSSGVTPSILLRFRRCDPDLCRERCSLILSISRGASPTRRRFSADFPFRGDFGRPFSTVGRFLGKSLRPREPRHVMARPLRIEFPGAIYHVTSRGNEKRRIFKNDGDRKAFLAFLAETATRFG